MQCECLLPRANSVTTNTASQIGELGVGLCVVFVLSTGNRVIVLRLLNGGFRTRVEQHRLEELLASRILEMVFKLQ